MMLDTTTIAIAFIVTLIAHVGAKFVLRYLNKYIKGIPMIIVAIVLTLVLLLIIGLDYHIYYAHARPVFDRLLGYSTVLLAVPLAGMDFKGLPVKKIGRNRRDGKLGRGALADGFGLCLDAEHGDDFSICHALGDHTCGFVCGTNHRCAFGDGQLDHHCLRHIGGWRLSSVVSQHSR